MDIIKIKKDFPIFKNNPHLVYLDSTATSLKPFSVVQALQEYYEEYSANIKRGIYSISEKATEEYEKTRDVVATFIHAKREEIIFTRNTTESINLVMYSLATNIVSKHDEIVVGIENHHSHFVPWQQLCLNTGVILKVINLNSEMRLDIFNDKFKAQNSNVKITDQNLKLDSIITKRTKILALTHVSNVLGTINPVKEIIAAARTINPKIIVIVDGAQAAPHMKVDVADLDCDFYAFSGHKMLGPTGVGVLFGKQNHLEEMQPFLFGGEMIREVHLDKTEFAELPEKFEAGTPAIGEVIAFRQAVEYLQKTGLQHIHEHEQSLARQAKKTLEETFGKNITFLNPNVPESGIVAFNITSVHPHDIASILDKHNICIRAGHHCAMPLHEHLNISSSARASFYVYNSDEDIKKLTTALSEAFKLFHR